MIVIKIPSQLSIFYYMLFLDQFETTGCCQEEQGILLCVENLAR